MRTICKLLYVSSVSCLVCKALFLDFKMASKLDADIEELRSRTEEATLFRSERFVCCPWKPFQRPNLKNLAKWKFFTKNNSGIPDDQELDRVLKVHEVDTTKICNAAKDKIQVTWIGHATVLVQFDGITILSDPVFLNYCGPNALTAYRRYRKAACEIKDILVLDAVIISHNHYDHLEKDAVREIASKFPHVKWFVALKQKDWIVDQGASAENVHEFNWWEEQSIRFSKEDFTFVCTPTQHWCARLPTVDDNKVLWCSWVIKGPTKSYYFAGDTGYYDKLFQAIGNKYGPFDLAAIPIGAYEPRYITEYQHVDPEEAVKIHQDLKSKQSVGMHWGTFELTNEFFAEPPQKVEEEMKKKDLSPNKFISLCHGETWCVGDERQEPPFMTYKPKGENSKM
ncbi:N-acyl-phosphatidylethanolamine-hydrolyzing phospholipase D-like isoform X2 [Mercenaria mercenaria]|uniref:N-acyl-phosphatidylethanolamine-hydrolyzing phospholipase D-like isoform X2 n=1 Tax=Mercenaria mercenaria TaxID=6596 RepID=UPI00234EC7DD|nr:N-acyl-phosphatidylethanolamine-hydrolyzing phospholipase D-like isoform X2 [Mercenaria mercenaria]